MAVVYFVHKVLLFLAYKFEFCSIESYIRSLYANPWYTCAIQDDKAHWSLTPAEILYYTLAYDWLVYG